MKALISYTSDWGSEDRVRTEEVNTLDDLLLLMEKEGQDLIISDKDRWCKPDIDFKIEVYDGYRE